MCDGPVSAVMSVSCSNGALTVRPVYGGVMSEFIFLFYSFIPLHARRTVPAVSARLGVCNSPLFVNKSVYLS